MAEQGAALGRAGLRIEAMEAINRQLGSNLSFIATVYTQRGVMVCSFVLYRDSCADGGEQQGEGRADPALDRPGRYARAECLPDASCLVAYSDCFSNRHGIYELEGPRQEAVCRLRRAGRGRYHGELYLATCHSLTHSN